MRRFIVFAAIAVILITQRAPAIIKVDLPLSKMFKDAQAVAVGRVGKASPQNGLTLEVGISRKLKGKVADEVTLQLPEKEKLDTKDTSDVVILVGKEAAYIHIANRWFMAAKLGGETPGWRITGSYESGARTFPGRTPALADALQEIKAGGKGLQDWVSHEVCLSGVFNRLDTGVKNSTFLLSHDLNGDGTLDVVVGNKDQSKAFLFSEKRYTDATAELGLDKARGVRAAAGDVTGDGVADLVIGTQVWAQRDGKFTASNKLDLGDEGRWLAIGIGDADGDKFPDVSVLEPDGLLLTASCANGKWMTLSAKLWEAGPDALAAAYSTDFGDNGLLHVMVVRPQAITRFSANPKLPRESANDFSHFTGIGLADCKCLGGFPIKPLLVTAYDYDGLGPTDFLLVSESGGIMLANRGHGAFLINAFAHNQFRPSTRPGGDPRLPFEPAWGKALAAQGRYVQLQPTRKRGNCLIIDEKGTLWEMENERKK